MKMRLQLRNLKRLLPVLLLPLVLIACQQPIAPPHPDDSGVQLLVEFGDSLATMSGTHTQQHYLNDPLWRASFNHWGGTRLDTQEWVDRYPSVGDLGNNGQPIATVMLALGTNDIATTLPSIYGPATQTTNDIKNNLGRAVDVLNGEGVTRIVVVNVNETSAGLSGGPVPSRESRLWATVAWNEWLDAVEASTNPRWQLVDVVDWRAVSAGRTDWLQPNDLHHNPAGDAAYAQFLYDQRLPTIES